MTPWLVLGVGNSLRSDDGVGPWLVEQLASRRLPGVETRTVFQLVPELADELARAANVVFVDASHAPEVSLQPLPNSASSSPIGHVLGPSELLDLSAHLFGHRPRAWLATVPGHDFDFGERLSPATETAARTLLARLELLVQEGRPPS